MSILTHTQMRWGNSCVNRWFLNGRRISKAKADRLWAEFNLTPENGHAQEQIVGGWRKQWRLAR